ncbi:isocitrate lyase/phosphoenolpyruvate mutase family protein [Pelagibius sp. CAU 1746]|uniref:isocitrate lyase/PEP mutase family protein n=1 Tax=Pelagibius sp. CAU 1746 TaxID=3140370 RepID=UPI00325B49EF
MTAPQTTESGVFRALHQRAGAFVIPNPWDVGSARLLASLGFEALATTSAGLAFSLGRPEGLLAREEVLAHCRAMTEATALPVSADLEKGFGDSPESAAETIRAAAATGLAGCSIEDYTNRRDDPIFDFPLAVERIAAAAEAARGLPRDFVLTARSENFLWGRPDLDDTIRRLQAFEAAGADVLYAPGLRSLDDIRSVCAALQKPVNVVMGLPGAAFTVQDLAAAGVKRISVGSAFARLAYGSLLAAAGEIAERGSFDALSGAIGFGELEERFRSFMKT